MKTPKAEILKWTAGFTIGVSVILWIFAVFPTKEQHNEYIKEHEKWESEAIKSIRDDIIDIKVDVKEIKNAVVTTAKKTASAILNTNLYGTSR